MDIRPIRNEEDHIAALKEIVGLWDAGDGTPEADRMGVLAILVEDYEANHFSFPPMAQARSCTTQSRKWGILKRNSLTYSAHALVHPRFLPARGTL
jgi:hypothetical protein